ncbi:hypothetical protein Daus18300_010702 [Diaporthe australafricana]|uniref:Uncharacterized protein n=1 Tax=Diaporthe australafricana TaxID=127596 RepID=A0ABR3W972_9PEZI
MFSLPVWVLICLTQQLATAQSLEGDTTSYIFYDNIDWLSNTSNITPLSYSSMQKSFANPSRRDSAQFSGLDWTKPFPGEPIDGFGAHLRVAHDVEVPESVMPNVTTQVSAITYSIPEAMMDGGSVPKAIDPSWYICQHYYVSTRPDPTLDVDHSCGFLPERCLADLNASLTENWGNLDDTIPCSGYALGSIPVSCRDTLGPVRSDVLGWDLSLFQDPASAKGLVVDEVGQSSWMIGTGFGDSGNTTAYYAASNRTYLVATVFGYSSVVDEAKRQAPHASLACLRPQWALLSGTDPSDNGTSLSPTSEVQV